MTKKFKVLLFYHYKKLNDVINIHEKHKEFFDGLDVKGRIIIASEGINGTISGSDFDCDKYKQFLENSLGIYGLDYKDDECSEHLFPKLSIKIKNEIIRMGIECDTEIKRGTHLKPKEWLKLMDDKDNIILDMRSDYEHKLGKFKNAITFDMKSMYEFPEIFEKHEIFKKEKIKNKKILTYCTGGIKCEKASNFLLNKGFNNVYQLEGGIIKYSKEVGGENFDGKCYVFDERIGIEVNKVNPKVISKCYGCNTDCDVMVNCMNNLCNRHMSMCKDCYYNFDTCCSLKCSKSDKRRKEPVNYFGPSS